MNTAASPTLNINSKGAKPICYNGSTTFRPSLISDVVTFIYDGTNYNILSIAKKLNTETSPKFYVGNFLQEDAGSSSATTNGNTCVGIVTNSITYSGPGITVAADSEVYSLFKIVGAGGTTVTSDANNVITVTSTTNFDSQYLRLSGGTISGQLTATDITTSNLVVNGVARFNNTMYGDITGSITMPVLSSAWNEKNILFYDSASSTYKARIGASAEVLGLYSTSSIVLRPIGNTAVGCVLTSSEFRPDGTSGTVNLGTDSKKWNTLYTSNIAATSFTGDITMSKTKGIYFTDVTNTVYGGIFDNGANLWIGARTGTSPHHTGETYISSGVDSSGAGYDTIKIAVPTKSGDTWTFSSYSVLHSNNYSSYALPLTGGTVSGTLILSKTTDLSGTANNSPALIVGTQTGGHIEIDPDEIQAKASGTTTNSLGINLDGGAVMFGQSATRVTISGGDLFINSGSGSFAHGIGLYGQELEKYGIRVYTTGTLKHGYVQGNAATYFYMSGTTTSTDAGYYAKRGWIFHSYAGESSAASISQSGNGAFSGSVTIGANSENTSGCEMLYDATTKSVSFSFR